MSLRLYDSQEVCRGRTLAEVASTPLIAEPTPYKGGLTKGTSDGVPLIFGDEDGTIYGVTTSGQLLWSRHVRRDGVTEWANGGTARQVGTGWAYFHHVFAGGDGEIYGVDPNGALLRYRHLSRDGDAAWGNADTGEQIGNTWNAYNSYGGRSQYTTPNGTILSFERPDPSASPVGSGINHLARAETWVLGWMQDAGYAFDLYTGIDFHRGITDLSAYKALILHTHPEYWTTQMLDRLEAYIGAAAACSISAATASTSGWPI